MSQKPPTKYLYIVGRGHSGSTIFSILVGQSDTVASEGEIVTGFQEGYQSKRCANGEIFSSSPFWSDVKRAFERRTGTGFDEAVRLLNRRADCTRVLPNLLASSVSPAVREAARLTAALYDSIAETSGRPVVLDSTKELATALFLLRHVDGTKLIHFVRSPFGVADSCVKQIESRQRFTMFRRHFHVGRHRFMPVVLLALAWAAECLFCEVLRLLRPSEVITLHYEDMCGRPIDVLERLERFTGVSLAGSKAAATERLAMQPSHALSGNRMMRGKQIVFAPERGVLRYLTVFDKAIVILCTFPMTIAYGYLGRRAMKPAMAMQQAAG